MCLILEISKINCGKPHLPREITMGQCNLVNKYYVSKVLFAFTFNECGQNVRLSLFINDTYNL